MFESFLSNRALWEQPLLDLWSIPHILSGVLLAVVFIVLRRNLLLGFGLSLTIAVLWEVVEHLTGISTVETPSNIVIDIVIMPLGFGAMLLLRGRLTENRFRLLASSLVALQSLMLVLGWLAYQQYAML